MSSTPTQFELPRVYVFLLRILWLGLFLGRREQGWRHGRSHAERKQGARGSQDSQGAVKKWLHGASAIGTTSGESRCEHNRNGTRS